MESFYEAMAPVWVDAIENGIYTIEDVPEEVLPYVKAEIERRKGNA